MRVCWRGGAEPDDAHQARPAVGDCYAAGSHRNAGSAAISGDVSEARAYFEEWATGGFEGSGERGRIGLAAGRSGWAFAGADSGATSVAATGAGEFERDQQGNAGTVGPADGQPAGAMQGGVRPAARGRLRGDIGVAAVRAGRSGAAGRNTRDMR